STGRSPSRSGPPSIGASGGIGYGPGSLSSSYSKLTGTIGCDESTMVNGMPIGAPSHSVPKSGCRFESRPMLSMKFSLFGCSGFSEMSVFHGLCAGNMGQPARVVPCAPGPPVVLVELAELVELPPPLVLAAEVDWAALLLAAVLPSPPVPPLPLLVTAVSLSAWLAGSASWR